MAKQILIIAAFTILFPVTGGKTAAQAEPQGWTHDAALMRPFHEGDTVLGESVLFVRDPETGEAKASVLFPIRSIVSVCRCSDWRSTDVAPYENGRDYVWTPGSREITLPAGSRILSVAPDALRRPEGSQPYRLTHRDGQGEILFGAKAEYHQMQTCITYEHEPVTWPKPLPRFDPMALPRTVRRLQDGDDLSIVLLGDSISTGCNASGWADAAPYQPPYQDLLAEHLRATFSGDITLTNLAVGGTSTPWGVTQVAKVVDARPDLVILAFGMNDAGGRSAEEYQSHISEMMAGIRMGVPDVEFILVASMLGNRDWTALKHELFPRYRDALAELAGPGVALADVTSLWEEFLNRKQDRDLTGNGVNHPNDFGHRVYAQVLTTLIVPPASAAPDPTAPLVVPLWPDQAPIGDGTTEQSDARITVHRPAVGNGTAIVICPGGGYGGLVTEPEGHGIARWLNASGITGVVLEYRLPHGRPFVPLLDAQRAIRLVRSQAADWGIHPGRVGIMGFSAGGHLAATAITHFDSGRADAEAIIDRQSSRPDFGILVYPVITMKDGTHQGSRRNLLGENPSEDLITQFSNETQVTSATPPVLLAHAIDDEPVPWQNSERMFDALRQSGVAAEFLKLPSGGHGLNGYHGPMWDAWQQRSLTWLAEIEMLPSD